MAVGGRQKSIAVVGLPGGFHLSATLRAAPGGSSEVVAADGAEAGGPGAPGGPCAPTVREQRCCTRGQRDGDKPMGDAEATNRVAVGTDDAREDSVAADVAGACIKGDVPSRVKSRRGGGQVEREQPAAGGGELPVATHVVPAEVVGGPMTAHPKPADAHQEYARRGRCKRKQTSEESSHVGDMVPSMRRASAGSMMLRQRENRSVPAITGVSRRWGWVRREPTHDHASIFR